MTMAKIGQKSVTYYLNGPLSQRKVLPRTS
jgi:hypothetical protein